MSNPCPNCNGKCCRDEFNYRIEHMAAEFYEHVCESCYDGDVPPPHDDPNLDGTDLSHPAWWRGQEQGVNSLIYLLNQMLNDIEAGKEHKGVFFNPHLNMLRDRLHQMYGK